MRRLFASVLAFALASLSAAADQYVLPPPVGTTAGTVASGIDPRITGAVQQGGDVSANTVTSPYTGAIAQTLSTFGGNSLNLNMFGAAPRNGTTSDTPFINAARAAAKNGQAIDVLPGILYLPGTVSGGPTNVVWRASGPLYKNNGTSPLTAIGPFGDLIDSYLQFPNNITKYYSQTDPTTATATTLAASPTMRLDRTFSGGSGTVSATIPNLLINCTQPGGGASANTYQFSSNATCTKTVMHSNGTSGNMVAEGSTNFRDIGALNDGLGKRAPMWGIYSENQDLTNQPSSVSGSMTGEHDLYANGDGTNRFLSQWECSSAYMTSFVFAGDTNTSDTILRNVTNIYNLVEGQPITGTGIPSGSAIAIGGINISAGQVTLTQQPTAAASQVALTSGIVPGNCAAMMYLGTNDPVKTPLTVIGDTTNGSVTVANVPAATISAMTVGRPIRATSGVPSGAYVASFPSTTSFNLDANHAATATTTQQTMIQTTGANTNTFFKADMPFNTAILDTSTAQRNDPNAAEILMAAQQRICLEVSKTYCITENASTITVTAGGSVGLQVFGQAGFRPFSTSGDPASPKVPGQLYFNSTANAYRLWSGTGSTWWTIPTLAQANTWTGVQTFAVAQNFAAGLSTIASTYTKQATAPAAPGAGNVIVFAVAGTNSGTCKLQVMAGTSATPVTIVDNVGAGC